MYTSKPFGLLAVGCFLVVALAIALPTAQGTARDVMVHRDIDYIDGVDYADNKDRLDVHMPVGVSNAPVFVFFHGGALQNGSKDAGNGLGATLGHQGIVVVSANYRLSPGVMHPAHLEDAAAAVAWTVANIGSHGGDPSRVFIGGHSAGAYLAAQLSLDPSYLRAHGLDLSNIRGTVPISPFLYVEEVAPDRPKTVWGTDEAVWRQASVKPYIGSDKQPMLLVYADGDDDWRREQNERLKTELKSAGNGDVDAVEIADRTHGSVLSKMAEAGDPGMTQIAAFIKRH